MENMLGDMSQRGTSLDSEPKLRLNRRLHSRGPTGQLAQDLGSSGFASNRTKNANKHLPGGRYYKERVGHGSSSGRQLVEVSDEEDELNFLTDERSSDVEFHKEIPKVLMSSQPSTQDPEYQQARSNIYKGMHFKKNKSENDNGIPSKSRLKNSSILEPKSPNLSSTSRLSSPHLFAESSLSHEASQFSHKPSKKSNAEKVGTVGIMKMASIDNGSDNDGSGRIFVRQGKIKKTAETTVTEPLPSKKERPKPKPQPKTTVLSALLRPPVGKLRPAPAANYPVSASPEKTPQKNSKPLSSKPESFPLSASPATIKNHNFPTIAQPAAFPLSPNALQQTQGTRKKTGLKRSNSSRADEYDNLPKVKVVKGASSLAAAPFPLDNSQFSFNVDALHKRVGKRLSNGSPQEDDSPCKRQRRHHDIFSSLPSQSFQHNDDSDDDDDTYFYNPLVDANTLCPYCDEPLPSTPTPHLKHLLAITAKKSVRAARPTNPMGRKAAVSIFMNVCQQHRFESKILPEAEAKGWPKSIEWDRIHDRVLGMRKHLQVLIENSFLDHLDDDSGVSREDVDEGSGQQKCARDICVFWKDAMSEVKEKGTRVAANVKSQFANFQNVQPGYYGELGSVLIHQSLYELFPPETTPPELVCPLSPKEFINRVLLPEVALRFIMEDKSLSGLSGARKALEILRDSTTYGVAMFPDDTAEPAVDASAKESSKGRRKGKGKDRYQSEDADNETATELNVADRMAREKARRRRKVLEEQEEDQVNVPKRRSGRKEKDLKAGLCAVQASSSQKLKPKPRPRPKAIQKSAASSRAGMNVGSNNENVLDFSNLNGPGGYSDNEMYSSQSDADSALTDWPLDDLPNDANYPMKDNGTSPPNSTSGSSSSSKQFWDEFPPPSSLNNISAGNISSIDDAMVISSETSESSDRSRKTRKQASRKARSASIEVSSPDTMHIRPQSPYSFDIDDTPKASRHQLSLSSSIPMTSSSSRSSGRLIESRKENTEEGTDRETNRWNNDPDSAPLAYLRSRPKNQTQKAPSENQNFEEKPKYQTARSTVRRSDSMHSDHCWLLSDESD